MGQGHPVGQGHSLVFRPQGGQKTTEIRRKCSMISLESTFKCITTTLSSMDVATFSPPLIIDHLPFSSV